MSEKHDESSIEPGLKHRVEDLEIEFEALENYTKQIVDAQLNEQDERIAELENKVDELTELVHQRDQEVAELHGKLESIAGLSDDEQSTPEKRATDLRTALIRQAKSDGDAVREGTASKTWRGVTTTLEDFGHGTIHPPQAYSAMEDAADVPGFSHTTNDGGDQIIKVNLAKTPASTAVNRINNENSAGKPLNASSTTVTNKSD